MALLLSIIILFIAYSVLIIYFWRGWEAMPEYMLGASAAKTTISVVVAARNEEGNIGKLMQALLLQTYPQELFEVIVVDDHSQDETANIVRKFESVRLINLREKNLNSYKKKAIETGIFAARNELIVITDADCEPSPEWLRSICDFKEETKAVFIAAPVSIECGDSIVEMFQAMDFMVLQGITAAAVYKKMLSMCNGANLAYEKKVFQEVNAFTDIDHIASGDDMLLMHKISKIYPDQIQYLKTQHAMVSTPALKTWKEFFQQRIRWASKAMFYKDKKIIFILFLVYLLNFSFLVLFVAGFFSLYWWLYLAGLWVAKTLVELPFFISLAKFYDKTWAIKMFFLFQPLHVLYTIVSGLFGQMGKYEWKGRRVR